MPVFLDESHDFVIGDGDSCDILTLSEIKIQMAMRIRKQDPIFQIFFLGKYYDAMNKIHNTLIYTKTTIAIPTV